MNIIMSHSKSCLFFLSKFWIICQIYDLDLFLLTIWIPNKNTLFPTMFANMWQFHPQSVLFGQLHKLSPISLSDTCLPIIYWHPGWRKIYPPLANKSRRYLSQLVTTNGQIGKIKVNHVGNLIRKGQNKIILRLLCCIYCSSCFSFGSNFCSCILA